MSINEDKVVNNSKITQNTPGVLEKSNTTKPPTRYRNWSGTSFETDEKEIALLKSIFIKWVIGKEICPRTKKEHLQWYGELKDGKTERCMKKKMSPRHIEVVKFSKAMIAYCKKDFNYETNIKEEYTMEIIGIKPLYKWQQKIIDIIKAKERRKINWFWEPVGNVGKSSFVRDLAILGRTLIVGGRKQDIFYAFKENKRKIDCVVVDIPRCETSSVSYGAIEKILDGALFSPKYESGMVIFDAPVVIVMSNFPPDLDEDLMSVDRWRVYEIERDAD